VDDVSLAERVKALRLDQGLSRAKLANEAGLSYTFIQQLETGTRRDPGVRNVAQLAKVFGITVDRLLGAEDADDVDSPAAASETTTSGSDIEVRPSVSPSRSNIQDLLDRMDEAELTAVHALIVGWLAGTAHGRG
jgi:transcriptional regulator with XRE-family HTH domain